MNECVFLPGNAESREHLVKALDQMAKNILAAYDHYQSVQLQCHFSTIDGAYEEAPLAVADAIFTGGIHYKVTSYGPLDRVRLTQPVVIGRAPHLESEAHDD